MKSTELFNCPVEVTVSLISDNYKLITRKVFAEVPPHVVYAITDYGLALSPLSGTTKK